MNIVFRRIRNLIRLAKLLRVDDSGIVQVVQVLTAANEALSDVESRQPYGYAYNPPKDGADPVVLSLNGNPSKAIVIQVGTRKFRLKGLAEGEAALYDDQGQQVWLKRTHIEINAPLGYVVNGDGIFNGDNVFNGQTEFIGMATANGHRIDETHTHNGVMTGPGNTGAVN